MTKVKLANELIKMVEKGILHSALIDETRVYWINYEHK